jgi:hypothetical protein
VTVQFDIIANWYTVNRLTSGALSVWCHLIHSVNSVKRGLSVCRTDLL